MLQDTNPNISLNTSMKSLFCNHCLYDFSDYAQMKEHYKSQFHLYNLHRVTMKLNAVTYDVFVEKKNNCKYNVYNLFTII